MGTQRYNLSTMSVTTSDQHMEQPTIYVRRIVLVTVTVPQKTLPSKCIEVGDVFLFQGETR